jgi:hypothetical protein
LNINHPQNVTFKRYIRINYRPGGTGAETPFPLSGYTPKGALYLNNALVTPFVFTILEDGLIEWGLDTDTLATLRPGTVYDFDIILVGAEVTYPIEPPGKFRIIKGETSPTL